MSIFKDKNFKGNSYLDKDGYVLIRMPEDEVPLFRPMYNTRGFGYEHRITMAKALNRQLGRWEAVHHKDKNRQNNIPENLDLIDTFKHLQHHKKNNDLKLFTSQYQPRWNVRKSGQSAAILKKTASDLGIRAGFTLGGAAIGATPGLLQMLMSKKDTDKQNALENSLFGAAMGGGAGFLGSDLYIRHGKDQAVNNLYKKMVEGSKIKDFAKSNYLSALGGLAGGSYGAYKARKAMKEPNLEDRKDKMLKAKVLSALGTAAGAGLIKLHQKWS